MRVAPYILQGVLFLGGGKPRGIVHCLHAMGRGVVVSGDWRHNLAVCRDLRVLAAGRHQLPSMNESGILQLGYIARAWGWDLHPEMRTAGRPCLFKAREVAASINTYNTYMSQDLFSAAADIDEIDTGRFPFLQVLNYDHGLIYLPRINTVTLKNAHLISGARKPLAGGGDHLRRGLPTVWYYLLVEPHISRPRHSAFQSILTHRGGEITLCQPVRWIQISNCSSTPYASGPAISPLASSQPLAAALTFNLAALQPPLYSSNIYTTRYA